MTMIPIVPSSHLQHLEVVVSSHMIHGSTTENENNLNVTHVYVDFKIVRNLD